jgi:hypothetical protein
MGRTRLWELLSGSVSRDLGWEAGVRIAVLLVALALLLTGCGLSTQARPQPAPSPPESEAVVLPQVRPVPELVQIYLLRDERLVPVSRRADDSADALDRLVRGPTANEIAAGIDTAVPPHELRLSSARRSDLAVIEVSDQFTALSGRSRLLAAAQVVWTVTDVCCASRVLLLSDGRALTLPTDIRPTLRPVRRADYRSVAPT